MHPTDDLSAFEGALRRLGRVMSHAIDAETVEDYFNDLKEFPLHSVVRAIDHIRKTAKFWPRPSIIREACVIAPGVARLTQIPHWVDPWAEKYFCHVCADSGFVRHLSCPGDGQCHVGHCGQPAGQATEHPYTRRCGCVASNPVLLRERDIQRQRMIGSEART